MSAECSANYLPYQCADDIALVRVEKKFLGMRNISNLKRPREKVPVYTAPSVTVQATAAAASASEGSSASAAPVAIAPAPAAVNPAPVTNLVAPAAPSAAAVDPATAANPVATAAPAVPPPVNVTRVRFVAPMTQLFRPFVPQGISEEADRLAQVPPAISSLSAQPFFHLEMADDSRFGGLILRGMRIAVNVTVVVSHVGRSPGRGLRVVSGPVTDVTCLHFRVPEPMHLHGSTAYCIFVFAGDVRPFFDAMPSRGVECDARIGTLAYFRVVYPHSGAPFCVNYVYTSPGVLTPSGQRIIATPDGVIHVRRSSPLAVQHQAPAAAADDAPASVVRPIPLHAPRVQEAASGPAPFPAPAVKAESSSSEEEEVAGTLVNLSKKTRVDAVPVQPVA